MIEAFTVEFKRTHKRHICGPLMTMEAMETAFTSVLARSNSYRPLPHIPNQTVEIAGPQAAPLQSELLSWSGSFCLVPNDFELPLGTLRVTWLRWSVGQPPLRLLTKHDMATRLAKVRLAEL
jgi:hypothetical protein